MEVRLEASSVERRATRTTVQNRHRLSLYSISLLHTCVFTSLKCQAILELRQKPVSLLFLQFFYDKNKNLSVAAKI